MPKVGNASIRNAGPGVCVWLGGVGRRGGGCSSLYKVYGDVPLVRGIFSALLVFFRALRYSFGSYFHQLLY